MKKNHFGELPTQITILLATIEKSLFCVGIFFCFVLLVFFVFILLVFFAGAKYHFADANWENPILCRLFLAEAKKSEL